MRLPVLTTALAAAIFMVSCSDNKEEGDQKATTTEEKATPRIKEETITYTQDTVTYKDFIAFDENKEGKRPVVLVVHEWWGLNDYARSRARQLAELGYVAMAVDMFGGGKTADNPGDAGKLAMPYYMNPQMTKTRLDLALAKVKENSQADSGNVAAIGYCYGGFVVLNAAKLGSDLKGVVSFHGGLGGASPAKDLVKAKVLVCHGADDNFVPAAELNAFKKSMDSVGAQYDVKVYANAGHAFSNPAATEVGQKFQLPIAYNAPADTASWNAMKEFLGTVFK